ncbi:hypothetical protein SMICM17S_01632 [Streptomyces microflavus]
MFLQRIGNKGIRLGTLFDRAGGTPVANTVVLDHDLDVAPELGRRLALPEVAELVAELASRLWAAGVRTGERIVVHKTDGFDISLLACAAARIGAVPVLLSPKLDGATVVELVRRAQQPYLVTDEAKLTGSLPADVFEAAREVLLTSGHLRGRDPAGVVRRCRAGRPDHDGAGPPDADHPHLGNDRHAEAGGAHRSHLPGPLPPPGHRGLGGPQP